MKTIIVKKTHEINKEEWAEIVAGFNEEFGKSKTADDLIRFYKANFKGYSYHGFAMDESGTIAGFTSVNPTAYKDANGTTLFAGLSGSTFVKKAFRNDIFVFHDIYKALRLACAADGCQLILGVPNKNSYKYVIKLLGFKFLYNLPYFVLPLRIKHIIDNRWLKMLSTPGYALMWLYVRCTRLLSLLYNPKEQPSYFNIDFPSESYALRFNESYTTIDQAKVRFTYRIYEEKGIRTAYLFDFTEKQQRSFRALSKAANYILSHETIDMIAFVGKLNLKQPLLLPLPKDREPQPLPLTIDILVPGPEPLYATYSNPDNWNFGLMNFDVR